MIKKTAIWVSMVFITCAIHAQETKEIEGGYFLEGVKDIKSGFQLSSNFTFKFFFTQNGIDRYGSGRWELDKNTVIFSGRLQPARSYKLLSARRVNDNFITVKFTDDNPTIVKNIECNLFTARGRQKLFTNAEGIVKFNKFEVDSIQIRSQVFPDHPFTFICTNKIQNNFEFAFEKSVYEVFFDNFILLYANNMLAGRHPLLKGNQFRFVKSSE
ncbi:MAG: hypothetical protein KF746_03750 [Chitinophagaceae bacterium]|nr:hypothetical protein [Chitinophagaceae bacterium]